MPESTPGEIREFPVPVIVTLASGKMLCPFGDMHEFAEFLLGHPVWTHEFADEKLWSRMKGAIYTQHPSLKDSESLAAEANKDNWESIVVKITQRFGETLPIQSVGAKRTEHPMESLQRMAGDKPVIVVEVPGQVEG